MKELRAALEGVKLAPKAVVGRVSLYLRQLEAFQRQGYSTVSSNQLGEPLSIKNAQVRKDLAFFGQFGHPGIGYRIDELITALRQILGIDRDWPIVLVGLGNLGRALLKYRGFRSRRFHIVAVFDNDPRKIGQSQEGLEVEPLDAMRKAVIHAQDQSGPLVRARRGGSAGGRPDDRQRHHGNPQLRPGAADGSLRHQRRGRRSERSTREPCVQGPEDPGRRFLRRIVFPLDHRRR